MRIFEKNTSSYGEKVNFVDENDVFVGYDMGQDCCEYADWYIQEKITPYSYDEDYEELETPNIEEYIFDKDFFEEFDSGDLGDFIRPAKEVCFQ